MNLKNYKLTNTLPLWVSYAKSFEDIVFWEKWFLFL